MKKPLSIVITFLLIFMTLGPISPASAALSPVTIKSTPATEGLNGTGTITVTGAAQGATLRLSPKSGGSFFTIQSANGNDTFSNVEPGIYTVTQEFSGEISASSNEARVLPSAVTVAAPNQNGVITVSGAKADAKLTIHHDKIGFLPRETTANNNGVGFYNVGYADEQVPPGKNYRVVQTINGVSSAESNSIDIAPERVRLTVTISGAGANNNGGAIRVDDTRKGNRLFLYKVASGTEPIIRTVEAADTYTFTGLSAGEYYVVQEENGAESPQSNYVKIIDEMSPTIELNGPAEDRVSMPKNNTNWEYPVSISDVTAIDNISTPTITYTINPDRKINTPGVYKITYIATDEAGNRSTVTKTVTVAPPTLEINDVVDTYIPDENPPGRATGDIWVDNVMGEATLKVYQDPGGKPVKTITRANDSSTGIFEITGVPVGTTYYVTQVVNGIESEPSPRVDIKDTTKPTIQLNNSSTIEFVRGDNYIEHGAIATDNVDNSAEISSNIVIDSSNVNTNVPGKYTVTYDVRDNAGNSAVTVVRTVYVKPHAVIAIGSNADLGEVGVKNAFPGAVLKLYSTADGTKPIAVSNPIPAGVTTYVFKSPTKEDGTIIDANGKIPPGSYYVVQEFNIAGGEILESMRSNIVDVRDTNRPYITITGSENLFHTWDITNKEYTYDKDNNIGQFLDPGATADDYLDDPIELTKAIKKKVTFGTTEICNETIVTNPPCEQLLTIKVPGVYTITYSVTTKRGTKADDKTRTVTVAPPKVGKLTPGKSTIKVDDAFLHAKAKTAIHLHNKYGQRVETLPPGIDGTVLFKDVPAGLGYYVTQTVNGVESAPSNPVNVTLFDDAEDAVLLTHFEFVAQRAVGIIDHNEGTINVVVPKDTILTSLKAKFEAMGIVKVGTEEQISGNSSQNFTNDVKYTVTSKDGERTKEYIVTVTKQLFDANTWTTTVHKNVTFSLAGSTYALLPTELVEARSRGISFIGQDRAIHVPAANVQEAATPSLTAQMDVAITNSSDPAWISGIQQPMSIRFGNSNAPFVQPIELEILNPNGKKFVRLVRDAGRLYAIVQPSESQAGNLIGLVTESGTYALMDDIAQPSILPNTSNGQTTFRLSTATVGAQIYYTTSSKPITFDRSARKASVNSYMLDGTPSDLEDWTLYKSGETITSPSGELYAFAMKDGIISTLSDHVAVSSTNWSPTVKRPTSHIFKITFNAKVDRKALYSNMVYVIDESTGEKVETRLELSADGKVISIIPTKAYTRGKMYTLHIEREMKGHTKNNEFLKQALTQTFIAE